jgi:hypothetical protein
MEQTQGSMMDGIFLEGNVGTLMLQRKRRCRIGGIDQAYNRQ